LADRKVDQLGEIDGDSPLKQPISVAAHRQPAYRNLEEPPPGVRDMLIANTGVGREGGTK